MASSTEQRPLSEDETSLEELRKSIETGSQEVSEEESTEETSNESSDVSASASDVDDGSEESVNPPEQTATKQEEWVVPGKFKTTDDLIRSYRELEGAFTRTTQELSKVRNVPQTPVQPVNPQEELRAFASKIEQNPVVALRELAREEASAVAAAAEEVRSRQTAFVSEYHNLKQNKEFVELEPTMSQLAEYFAPLIKNQNDEYDPRLLHALFWMAKGLKQNQVVAKERQKAELNGELKARKKQRVQVEGGSSTKGRVTKSADEMSLDELRNEINRGNLG